MQTDAAGSTKPPRERRLQSDVSLMFGAKVVVLATGVVSSVVIARSLGPDGRGAVAVGFGFVLLLVQLGSLGLPSANPYFTAKDPDSRARVVVNALWLAVGLSIVLAAIGVGIRVLAPGLLEGLTDREFAIVLASIPATLASLFLLSVLLGMGRTVAYNAVDASSAAGTMVALIVVLVALDGGVAAALAVMAGGRVAAAAVCVFLLRDAFEASADRALAVRMLAYGLRAYVVTLLAFLIVRIDVLLVNAYVGLEQAGYYAVAVALADGLYILPTVIATNLFPRVVRGLPDAGTARVFRVLTVVYGFVCLMSMPLAGPVIGLLYGDAFSAATELYLWLAPGIFCLGMLTVLAQHFAGRGFPLETVLVWFVGLFLNLAINLLFLNDEGAVVASIASSIAYAVLLSLYLRMFARDLGGYRALWPSPREALQAIRFARTER